MSEVKISNRYAKALMEEAVNNNKIDVVVNDMQHILDAISKSKDLSMLLHSPIVKESDKKAILEKIFSKNISPDSMKLLQVLLSQKREEYLSDVAKSFIQQYHKHEGITLVEIVSSIPLSNKTLDNIKKLIQEQLKLNKIELSTNVDDKILGGVILKIGDKIYDISIFSKLTQLKKVLTN